MPVEKLRGLKFGYVPYAPGGGSPGDRRRFPAVAQALGLDWELYREGSRYDVVYLSSNGDLTVFRRAPRGGPRIGFDMVDSYLSVPTWEPRQLSRGVGKWLNRTHSRLEPFYRSTLAGMCRRADLVVCATPEQQAVISAFNGNVHPILDLHDELGSVTQGQPVGGETHLFWEGIGLTAGQFSAIAPVLRELHREFPLRLHLVTDLKHRVINLPLPRRDTGALVRRCLGPGIPFHLYEWNPTAVRALAGHCHLGVIPLHLDQPLFADKPENKLLIMWRLGLPAIVSATPAYRRTMAAYGGPNWACADPEAWYTALRQALTTPDLREQAATAGRDYVETHFGLDTLLRRWVEALSTLL